MNTERLSEFTTEGLAAVANPEKAAPMAAYMKTDQPFYGVQKAGRTPIYREMIERFPPRDGDEYREAVLGLDGFCLTVSSNTWLWPTPKRSRSRSRCPACLSTAT